MNITTYVKSLVLYLEKMEKLEEKHPHINARFMDGLFVLRRSDSYWAGVFSDLYIEKVLMGSIKSVGGLTRGRGYEESTRLTWLLSMPVCGEVNKAIQEVSGLSTDNAAIHKDLSKTNMERNTKDLQTILDYFEERKPFAKTTTELRSLS